MNTNFTTHFIITLAFSLLISGGSMAANLFARADGNWTTNGTWATTLGGASCGCTPAAGDNITIPSPFTVTLSGDVDTAINSLTIDNGGTLDGNNKKLEGIVNTLTNNGVLIDAKDVETGRLLNTGNFEISGKIKLTIETGIIFNNSGRVWAQEMKEGFDRYPVPLGTFVAGTYPEYFNSGPMTLTKKLQFDGYFTNEATGNIVVDDLHVDGMICNRGVITTDELTMHGGTSDCAGFWIVEVIDFDTNGEQQPGGDTPGVLNLGDYCTSSGTKPTINSPNDGVISSDVTFCTALLPVEMVSFEGIDNGNHVVLSWATASEIDNDHFEVLYSSAGTNFTQIGSVKSTKNGYQTQNYQFEYLPENVGMSYYQLRQVDTNGESSLSEIIAVNYLGIERKNTIQVFPNPTNGSITLTYFNSKKYQGLKGILYNLQGVALKEMTLDKTKNKHQIDLSGFSAGIYILLFENGTRIKICKL